MTLIVIYFIGMIRMLSNGKMNLKYALLWIAVGISMLLLTIFPKLAERLFALLGVKELTNGIFAVALFGLIIIATSITSIVSIQNSKIKKSVQAIGTLEKRIRELEKQNDVLNYEKVTEHNHKSNGTK